MSDVIKVEVVVWEDGTEVGSTFLTYFRGQDYSAELVTPDGKDWVLPRRAGGDE